MSDLDGHLPSEAAISKTLRDVVIATHKSGKAEDLTLKRVRARAEQQLGLDAGFFKQNSIWKQKSDTIVKNAVEKYCGDEAPPDPKPQTAVAKPKAKPKAQDKKVQGVKRKAAAPPKKPKKRRKTSSEEESEAELSDAESEPSKQSIRRGRQIVPEDSDEDNQETTKTSGKPRNSVVDEESDSEPSPRAKTQKRKDNVSESDMSELVEDSPAKKSKQKTSSTKPKKEKAPPKPKATPAKSKGPDDPDEAEIKRLQGWLVKCGIRKIWSRDPALSKCNSAKEKIQVLKNMLKDAGMDGKYSNEKAAAIKEQREFAKDLAAIQEGELAWGNTGEVTSIGRPSRRAAAKPVPKQKVVLSDDSDEEMKSNGEPSADDDDDDAMVDVEEDDEKDDDSGDDASDLD